MKMWSLIVSLLWLSGVAQASLPFNGVVVFSSGYLPDEQATYSLQVRGQGSVDLTVDRNLCTTNELGQARGCTRMAFRPKAYSPKELVTKEGVTVYELDADYRLAVERPALDSHSVYLLKTDADGKVLKRIALFARLH